MFLRLANVRHRYGDRVALDGVSFAVPRGAIFGLLGPNGAGKSTLFKILAGTLQAQGGTFELAGTKYDPTEPAQRRRIGVVFQDPSLDELLTGRENLLLALSLYGVIGAAARARVDEILALVELGDRQHEPVGRYSGGMKRRLELGRVLLHRPELLLMDEPSRGLDAASLRRYWTELLAWQRRDGLTILLTTHQPEEAQYASRIAVLDGGRLIAEDSPEALQQQVGGDVVTVEAEEASALLPVLTAALPGAFQVVRSTDHELVLEAPRGHELIPRLVECFPPGRLRSVAMRRPSLGDVFIKLTGRGLDIDTSLGTHPATPSPRPR